MGAWSGRGGGSVFRRGDAVVFKARPPVSSLFDGCDLMGAEILDVLNLQVQRRLTTLVSSM